MRHRPLLLTAAVLTAAPLGAQTSPVDQPSRPLAHDPGRDNDGAAIAADRARDAADVAACRAVPRQSARASGGATGRARRRRPTGG